MLTKNILNVKSHYIEQKRYDSYFFVNFLVSFDHNLIFSYAFYEQAEENIFSKLFIYSQNYFK